MYLVIMFMLFFFMIIMNMNLAISFMLINNMLYLDFIFDIFNLIFSIIVVKISIFVYMYSKFYFKFNMTFKYKINLMIFINSMLILINSNNLISMIIGWDGLGISSFFLVSYYFNNDSCISSLVTFFFNRLGDSFMLIMCSMLFFNNMNMMNIKFNMLIFIIMFIGLITKSSQMPFGVWLPMAMSAPTPISSLVHSSTLVTAGIYVLIKLKYSFFDKETMILMLLFSISTFLLGGLFALSIMDLKKAVAFSTLSQLGFILFSMIIGNFLISFYHLIFHAFFKSSLFMNLGVFMNSTFSNQDMRFMNNSKNNKIVNLTFLICCLNLMGMISFMGFFSKDLILIFFFSNVIKKLILIMLFMGCVITGSYSIKFLIFLINEKLNFYNNFNKPAINFFMSGPMISSIIMMALPIMFMEMVIIDMENFIFLSNKIFFYMILIFSFILNKSFMNFIKINYFSKMMMILDLINIIMKKMLIKSMKTFNIMMIEEFIQLNLIKKVFNFNEINMMIKFNLILFSLIMIW